MAEPLRVAVSGYQRTRMVTVRMARGERRELLIDFNGAMQLERTITSATFRTNFPHFAYLGAASLTPRSASVLLDSQAGSITPVRCDVTLDDGTRLSQYVMIVIAEGDWFEGETAPAPGPRTVTVTA